MSVEALMVLPMKILFIPSCSLRVKLLCNCHIKPIDLIRSTPPLKTLLPLWKTLFTGATEFLSKFVSLSSLKLLPFRHVKAQMD